MNTRPANFRMASLFSSMLVFVFALAGLAMAQTESGKARPKIISGGVLNGKAISLPQPVYPAVAKAAGASGTVTVQVTVDEEGNVASAVAIAGHPLLRAASVAAARGAKFIPTKLEGIPVKVTGTLDYNFVLPKEEPKDAPGPVARSQPRKKRDKSNEPVSRSVQGCTEMTIPPQVSRPAGVDGSSIPARPVIVDDEPAPIPRSSPMEGGVLNGKTVTMPRPTYPSVAKAAHASGSVSVRVTVDEEGKVIAAEAISGHPLLRGAAVSAARGATFAPTEVGGKRVVVTGTLLYEFILD